MSLSGSKQILGFHADAQRRILTSVMFQAENGRKMKKTKQTQPLFSTSEDPCAHIDPTLMLLLEKLTRLVIFSRSHLRAGDKEFIRR